MTWLKRMGKERRGYMWEKMWDRINNENENITDFNFVTGWLYTDGQKKVKLLMRTETEILKTEIHSREVERDPGVSYEVRGGHFYKVSGVFKTVYGESKNKFWERVILDLATREILVILSNSPGENQG